MDEEDNDPIALHVLVVGFHHKRGMQVEYCYPPLISGDSSSCELPEMWRHLPSLCLPDGAHNHEADTVFFHLPHLTDNERTVFGVSCYRQIDAEKVANKTADITRNSVQKSVCVLCTLPIYGYIQERLHVTTRVYFKGADFADVRDLEGLYRDLNTANWRDKLHHGVNVTECVRVFGRNLLVLFKLVLLERGVLLYHSPVSPVARTIASLLALLPHTLPEGVMGSAAVSNFSEPKPDVADNTDSLQSVTMLEKDSSLNSSIDSALEKSAEIVKNSSETTGADDNRHHSSKLSNGLAGSLLDTGPTTTTTGRPSDTTGINSSKSIDSNQSEDSAVVASGGGDYQHNSNSLYHDARQNTVTDEPTGLETEDDEGTVTAASEMNGSGSAASELQDKQDGSAGGPSSSSSFAPGEGSLSSLSLGRVSTLRDGPQKQQSVDAQSVDSSCAVASTQATTGADTPTNTFQDSISDLRSSNSSLTSVTSRASFMSPLRSENVDDAGLLPSPPLSSRLSNLKGRLSGAFSYWTGREKAQPQVAPPTPASSPTEEGTLDPLTPGAVGTPLVFPELQQAQLSVDEEQAPLPAGVPHLVPSPPEVFAALEPRDCGLPLDLFTEGYLVHPYLSLQQLELISSPRTRAFLAGASNTLFLHKRPLYDVLVQVSEGKVEILEPELRRQLSLSTEDLRFADNIVRQVEAVTATSAGVMGGSGSVSPNGGGSLSPPSSPLVPTPLDVWVEGVGWVGGEEWLRHQFRVYLITMMRTSLLAEGSREVEMFNSSFMSAWRETQHYKRWLEAGPHPPLMEVSPCHPNAGHLSMADVRIRLAHSLLGGERSRRLNQTLANTGTAVVKTKEAVGGALTSARGALTSLWSSITTAAPDQHPELAVEATEGSVNQTSDGTEPCEEAAVAAGPLEKSASVEEDKKSVRPGSVSSIGDDREEKLHRHSSKERSPSHDTTGQTVTAEAGD